MIIVALVIVGLCLGSFVNALVWRIHEQEEQAKSKKKSDKRYQARLSIAKGRSMCPDCKHELTAKDLVPVLSWLSLGGKCRYCKKPIPVQYPLVELVTACLFVASYIWWPESLEGAQMVVFGLWLAILTGLMALLVYDARWMLLPNRLVYPLTAVAGLQAVIAISLSDSPLTALINTLMAVVVGGGIFYVLFQVSAGKWIGGGDVRLGWLLGLIVATPAKSVLLIFLASILGTLVSLPLLLSKRMKRTSTIPFGPFLIAASIIVVLFGTDILSWYQSVFLPFTI
ncbi:MAG: prepilin peptidase [Patescibacteria group bacterium]